MSPIARIRSRVLVPVFAIACYAVGSTAATAATNPEDELGNWFIWNGTIRFSDRWSLFTESHLRLWEVASNKREFFVRLAPEFHTSQNTLINVGYTYLKRWEFIGGDVANTENRIHEQFTGKHPWGRSTIEHRLRLEQRWIKTDGETNYENRFRYRLQGTVPISRPTLAPRTHFINVNNELFLKFGDVDDTFDQNRLYGAWGYQFTKLANLQLGLLWQHKKNEDLWQLQIFYTHNFDLRDD